MSDNEKSDYLDYPEPFVNFFRFSKNICKKKKIEICEPNYFLENRYSNDNFLLNDSWEGKCECKNILEEKNLKEMSETEKSAKENYTKKDVKEGRKLFDIIHKIQNNKYCQSFELFVKKYYLSKKQSYITILRKNIEELFNFNDEYLVPLSQFKVENLYDSSNITIKLRNSNNSLNFGFFRQPRAEELEISIENHDWKTILIHGVEKMMLAQNFSEQYQRINELANFYVGMKTVYDVSLTKNKIKEIEDLENDSRLICRYEKNENVLDIIINISITALIPHLNNKQKLFTFSKISLNGELKFEDIDTILVTHKEMKYKIPTNIKINASGHNCLHETKSLRNFLSKLDKNSNCKIGKKNYSVSEFICDEENWFNQENNFRAKKLNKIIKFHILQYSKKTFQNILKTSYYIEISIQNHKSDFRLLINLLKGIGNLENIFLINFNIDLMENQYTEFYDFLDKNKRLWFKNRYLWNIKINENCDPFVHNQILDFKKLLSKKRLLFLQCFAIENMRKSKILKFRKEVCQEIIDYLI